MLKYKDIPPIGTWVTYSLSGFFNPLHVVGRIVSRNEACVGTVGITFSDHGSEENTEEDPTYDFCDQINDLKTITSEQGEALVALIPDDTRAW